MLNCRRIALPSYRVHSAERVRHVEGKPCPPRALESKGDNCRDADSFAQAQKTGRAGRDDVAAAQARGSDAALGATGGSARAGDSVRWRLDWGLLARLLRKC